MKREDIFDAVTDLRDDQILAGEKAPAGARSRRFRRLGALAAVLAAVMLAGILLVPKLGGRAPTGTEPSTDAQGTQAVSPKPTDASPELELLRYTLAGAEYPQMAPYADLMSFRRNEGYDYVAYDKALEAWEESRSQLRPETDYTEGLDRYLDKAVPMLLAGKTGENRVCSPLNVYMALAMLSETTEGSTRRELLNLLGVGDLQTLRDRANAMWRSNYCDDGRLTSILAASLWLRDGTTYNQDTLGLLASNYYASVFSGPVGTAPYNRAMQSWVNEQTRGLLADQVGGLETTRDTVLALLTTIYYKTSWIGPFTASETRTFHCPEGDEDREFLLSTGDTLYYTGSRFTAVGRGLNGGGTMYFLLPEEGTTPEALLASADALAFVNDPVARNHTDSKLALVHLALPGFDVSSQTDLMEGLQSLGVREVFTPQANFTPLTTDVSNPICVTEARHGARVRADKDGVEGAAYTFIDVTEAAEIIEEKEEIYFTLDRPFLFVAVNSEGLPLFVGVVNEP